MSTSSMEKYRELARTNELEEFGAEQPAADLIDGQAINPQPARKKRSLLYWIWRILFDVIQFSLMVGIIFGAWYMAQQLIQNSKKAERKSKPKRSVVVDIEPITIDNHTVTIEALGQVKPSRNVSLQARVRGEVLKVHPQFFEGGLVKAGEHLIELDQQDYLLEQKRIEAELKRVDTEIAIEEGNQAVARREFELFGDREVTEENKRLVLRIPQIESLKAKKAISELAIDQVKLNLDRTILKVPFDSLIRTKEVELGANLNSGQTVARLTDTGTFWIEVLVPMDELPYVNLQGSTLTAFDTAQPDTPGRVVQIVRVLSEVENQGRMAKLLVAIDDPLSLKPENKGKTQLLLGAFVKVIIQGKKLEDTIAIPRPYLREGDVLWVLTEENKLAVHHADILWRDKEAVIIQPVHTDKTKNQSSNEVAELSASTQLITTDLSAAVPGMQLQSRKAFLEAQAQKKRENAQKDSQKDDQKSTESPPRTDGKKTPPAGRKGKRPPPKDSE